MAEGREDLLAYTEARPDYMEESAVITSLFLQQVAGNPMYFVHLGGVGVDHVAKAKSEGRKVYAETCPHYLTFDVRDKAVQKFGKLARLNPSLKTKELGEKLWWGIQNGIIDTIGTDHCALTTGLKDALGNIWSTVPGFPGVATLLPVMLSEGVNKGRIGMEKVAEITSANTAKIFGIYPQKGTIAIGSDADFAIVDLNKEVKVTPDVLQSRSDYTLYDGWMLKGWPVMTIVRGKTVMKDGKVIGNRGWGKIIPRGITSK
jgi:dihydropyrimidinase